MAGFDFEGALEDRRLHDAERRLSLAALRWRRYEFASPAWSAEGARHEAAEDDALGQAAREYVEAHERGNR